MFTECFDEVKILNISDLHKSGHLKSNNLALKRYEWLNSSGLEIARASLIINMSHKDPYVEMTYVDYQSEVIERFYMCSKESNLGRGVFWYFICPESSRLCRKLYLINGRFLSRYANPKTMYKCQIESRSDRPLRKYISINGTNRNPKAVWDYDNKNHFRTHYKGNITKRYKEYLTRKEKLAKLSAKSIFPESLAKKIKKLSLDVQAFYLQPTSNRIP